MTSANETADAVRTRQVTSRQVLERCLDRIGKSNGPINAFVYLDEQGALAAADALDKRIANGEDRARVQAAGRWISEASFVIYVDVIGALHVDTQVA